MNSQSPCDVVRRWMECGLPVYLLAVVLMIQSISPVSAGSSGFGFAEEKIPAFNVPYTSAPPTIDGEINPDEWRDATKLMGTATVKKLGFIDRPHTFYIAWDEEHLYVAARAHFLPNDPLKQQSRRRYATGVVHDDAFEFGIDLLGLNNQGDEVANYYKFIINALGSGEYMKNYPSIGQYMYNWRPDPQIATSFHAVPEEEIHVAEGEHWFDLEFSMDLENLEMPRSFKAGDELRMLFAADLKEPAQGYTWNDIPSATGHLESVGYPRLRLTRNEPYVQIERLTGLHDGRVDLRAVVYNPDESSRKVQCRLDVVNAGVQEDAAEFIEEVTCDIPAGGHEAFEVDRKLEDFQFAGELKHGRQAFSAHGTFHLQMTDPKTPENLYDYHLAFQKLPKDKRPWLSYRKDKGKREKTFPLAVKFNPVRHQIFIEGDTLDVPFPDDAEAAGLRYRIVRDADGEEMASGLITQYAYYKYSELVELPELQPGQYTGTYQMVDADGNVLMTRERSFTKKDEAKEFSEWWDNDIGDPSQLLEPFDALKVSSGFLGLGSTSISAVGREYGFGALGLPRGIQSNDGPVMAEPARLVVVIDGEEHVLQARGRIDVTEKQPWRVELEDEASVAGLDFQATGWMEQDGLVNVDLKITPEDGPVTVDALRVEWPLVNETSTHMVVIGNGGNYSARYIDKVPDGEGEVWNTIDAIGVTGAALTAGNFYRNVWIGNHERGLLWCSDTDRGWVKSTKVPSHSVVRDGETLILQNNIIGSGPGEETFTIDSVRRVNLQYNASPFKPLTPGWRLNQVSAANGFTDAPKYKFNWDTGEEHFTVLSPPFKDKSRWDEYYAHLKEVASKQVKGVLYRPRPRLRPYLNNQIALRGYGKKTLEPGLYSYFNADWTAEKTGETLNESYNDYMVYLMQRQVQEGGCRHFYFDISFSRNGLGLAADYGYPLPDGRLQPTGGDDQLRDWYRRVYAMMQENDAYPGGVSGHATNSFCLKAMPFADAQLDSEFPMEDSVTVYPKDRMIAMSCPHNFGTNVSHLGELDPHWAAMHDAGAGGSGYPFSAPEFRRWGITAGDVEFLPYWDNEVVEEITPGLMATMWKRPGSVVVEVFNYGEPDEDDEEQPTRTLEATLDLDALGIPESARDSLRVHEFMRHRLNGQVMIHERYEQFKWYRELDTEMHPWNKGKLYPDLREPELDPQSGQLSGIDVWYHFSRYIEIEWDDMPAEEAPGIELFDEDQRDRVLDWGIARNGTSMLSAEAVDEAVSGGDGVIDAQIWTRDGTALLRLTNTSDEEQEMTLTVDQETLGVKPVLFEDFLTVTGARTVTSFDKPKIKSAYKKGTALYDGWTGELKAKFAPGETRLITLDRF